MAIAEQTDMKGKNIHTDWPAFREFGWRLKEIESTTFQIKSHPENGQMVIILNHPIVRGVSCSMIHWWFQHFANLKIRLKNVGNYGDGDVVPAYFLWHPKDHFGATLLDQVEDGKYHVGARIHIQEAMSFDKYERKYLVDDATTCWYLRNGTFGGQGMGVNLPFGSWILSSRICWEDVKDGEIDVGVHYHYEMTIGIANKLFGKWINPILKYKKGISEEWYREWNRHNVIEVGTFENFLPRLYDQRDILVNKPVSEWIMEYDAKTDDAAKNLPIQNESHDPSLVDSRMDGYMKSDDTHQHLRTTQALGDKFYKSDE